MTIYFILLQLKDISIKSPLRKKERRSLFFFLFTFHAAFPLSIFRLSRMKVDFLHAQKPVIIYIPFISSIEMHLPFFFRYSPPFFPLTSPRSVEKPLRVSLGFGLTFFPYSKRMIKHHFLHYKYAEWAFPFFFLPTCFLFTNLLPSVHSFTLYQAPFSFANPLILANPPWSWPTILPFSSPDFPWLTLSLRNPPSQGQPSFLFADPPLLRQTPLLFSNPTLLFVNSFFCLPHALKWVWKQSQLKEWGRQKVERT